MLTKFEVEFHDLMRDIMYRGVEVEVGEWQSQDVRTNPDMTSRELRHVRFEMDIPTLRIDLDEQMGSTLSRPWAEDHFAERVSGYPLNPPPSESYWPYARQGNAEHKIGEKFHHTYPERMWPKDAQMGSHEFLYSTRMRGIRYDYGDLMDVVHQLRRNPLTRQAYLPIWFPEDTGATGTPGQRVPCTLGYHFLIRPDRADIVYYIRSCDLLRHFTDDVYMAARLLQWVAEGVHLDGDIPLHLIMHISSLHFFRGDYEMVKRRLTEYKKGLDDDFEYGAAI